MRKVVAISSLMLLCLCSYSQKARYDSIVKFADEYFKEADYKSAARLYDRAYEFLGGKAMPKDRYKAARAFAKIRDKNAAFAHLQRLADKTDFLNAHELDSETDFYKLKKDKRWALLIHQLNPNNEQYNDSMSKVLARIYDEDQYYRLYDRFTKYSAGYYDDPLILGDLDRMRVQDSMNEKMVTAIIDRYGWLSANQVGKTGNEALWLVIQHAPLSTQEKYFPIMRSAVDAGKAYRRDLAYLQDRILVRKGEKQIYGTQYTTDLKTGVPILDTVDDPDNLNKRRESVGLAPMTIDK